MKIRLYIFVDVRVNIPNRKFPLNARYVLIQNPKSQIDTQLKEENPILLYS